MPSVSPFILHSNCSCVGLIFSSSFIIIVSGKLDVVKQLNWKITQYVLKKGSISSNLPPIFARCAVMYARMNDGKKSNEFATTAQALMPRIRDDKKNYVQSMIILCNAMCLSRPFRRLTSPFLQTYYDCKVSCDDTIPFLCPLDPTHPQFACLYNQAHWRGGHVSQWTHWLCPMLLRCRL